MKNRVLNCFLIIGIFIIIYTLLYCCMLSLPFSDDFALARKTREYLLYHDNNLFISALANTKDAWLKWQGTYTGCFSAVFFNAFYTWGLLGMRVLNTVVSALFFAALYYLVNTFCKSNEKPQSLTLWVYLIFLFCITNNSMFAEIYTWYTGIVVYLIPCVFLLLEEAAYIKYIRKQGHEWIVATVCGVLAGGAVINMATLACGICLITTVYGFLQFELKSKIKTIVPLGATVMGTLLNVLAPGNYARWEEKGELNILKVAGSSLLYVFKRVWDLSSKRPFVILMIVLFVVVYKYAEFDYGKRITYNHPYALLALFILGCAIVNFPYCLGLRVQNPGFIFENRALFVEDLSIYLLFITWVFYFAGYIRKKYKRIEFDKGSIITIVLLCFSFAVLMFGSNLYLELTSPYVLKVVANGSLREYVDYQERILNEIEKGGKSEVTVVYDLSRYAPTNPMIIGLWLSDNPDRWDYYNNQTVAEYYEKKRVDVEYINEDY